MIDNDYFLLESVEGGKQWGRYSFLGFQPMFHITCKKGVVYVQGKQFEKKETGKPMDILRKIWKTYRSVKVKGMPPFVGGFVGYFSYEMVKYGEPKLSLKESEFPEFAFMFVNKIIAYDHLKQKIQIVVHMFRAEGEKGYQKAVEEIQKIMEIIYEKKDLKDKENREKEKIEFQCNISKEKYIRMVEKTKNYIREGDIFQGVISRRFEAFSESSLLNAYRVLRTTNPSSYMYFIQLKDMQITGASPETMVKLENRDLYTFPVAGTRRRGQNVKEDICLEKELLEDEKERAEHNMLVDLARNDLGKIAKFGSVEVEDYMSVHKFSKVMHIASVVKGKLKEGKDGCHAVEALLPAGTLSGAPKFRACELIGQLEPDARGIYGGAIGYLDLSGNVDMCIAIRTAIKKGKKIYVQAGAGIVADSIAEKEYEECTKKAEAMIEAVIRAEEVKGL